MGAPFSHPVQRARRYVGGWRSPVALGLVAALCLVTAGRAAAAPAAGQPASSLALVEQSPAWVTNASGLTLAVSVSSSLPRSDLGLSVTLYTDATARSAFQQTLSGDLVGFSALPSSALIPLTTPGLATGPGGSYEVHLPVSAAGLPGQARAPTNGTGTVLSVPCAASSCAGVYPIEVSLVNLQVGTTLDEFTTYLLLTPPSAVAATDPLQFSWLLTLGSEPAIRPDGTGQVDPATLSDLSLILSELRSHPSTGLSVELFGQLAEAAGIAKPHGAGRQALALLRALSTGTPSAEIIPETYTPVSEEEMVDEGLGPELAAQLARSKLAMDKYLGASGSGTEYVSTAPIGPASLAVLAAEGVSRVLVPTSDVAALPPGVNFTPMMPFVVTGSGAEAIASYPALDLHLTGPGDPVLRANQLLADLAVIYFQGPDEPKGVALASPLGFDPGSSFMSVLMDGLATSPIVHATTLAGLFDRVAPGVDDPALTRRALQPTTSGVPGEPPAAAVTAARAQLGALESMSPVFDSMPGLQDGLLLAETAGLGVPARDGYLASVSSAFRQEVALFTLPFGHTITVTSLQAKVPITIFSRATIPLRTVLTVSSPDLGLPGGRTFPVVLRPRSNSVTIALSARSSGDFPLILVLSAPNGTPLLSGRLTIRSTAISGVAVALSIGAVVFLLIWWSRSILQRRRKKHQLRGAELAAQVAGSPPTS